MNLLSFDQFKNTQLMEREVALMERDLRLVMNQRLSDDEYMEFLYELVEQDGDLDRVSFKMIRENCARGYNRALALNEKLDPKEVKSALDGCVALVDEGKPSEFMVEKAGKPKEKSEVVGAKVKKFTSGAAKNVTKVNGVMSKILNYVSKKMMGEEVEEPEVKDPKVQQKDRKESKDAGGGTKMKNESLLNEVEMTAYPVMSPQTSFKALSLFGTLHFGFLYSPMLMGLFAGATAMTGGVVGAIAGIVAIAALVLTAIVLLFRRKSIRRSMVGAVGDAATSPIFTSTLGPMSKEGAAIQRQIANQNSKYSVNAPRKAKIGDGTSVGMLQKRSKTSFTGGGRRSKRR